MGVRRVESEGRCCRTPTPVCRLARHAERGPGLRERHQRLVALAGGVPIGLITVDRQTAGRDGPRFLADAERVVVKGPFPGSGRGEPAPPEVPGRDRGVRRGGRSSGPGPAAAGHPAARHARVHMLTSDMAEVASWVPVGSERTCVRTLTIGGDDPMRCSGRCRGDLHHAPVRGALGLGPGARGVVPPKPASAQVRRAGRATVPGPCPTRDRGVPVERRINLSVGHFGGPVRAGTAHDARTRMPLRVLGVH